MSTNDDHSVPELTEEEVRRIAKAMGKCCEGCDGKCCGLYKATLRQDHPERPDVPDNIILGED